MNVKPLADRVLIEPAPAETKTVGGIIIPDTAKEKPLKGTIVAVGNGTKDEEMVLKQGDEVLYGKYAGTEIELEGKKYLIRYSATTITIAVDTRVSIKTNRNSLDMLKSGIFASRYSMSLAIMVLYNTSAILLPTSMVDR